MLYVSRCVKSAVPGIATVKYGVVDTDDCTETMISWAQLASMLQTSALDIKGVEYDMQSVVVDGVRRKYPRVVRIGLYKGKGTLPRDKITTI